MLTLKFQPPIGRPLTTQAAAGDYRIFLAPINQVSDDDRVIVGSLGWRDQVPLMFSDSEQAHTDARHVGNVVDIRIESVGDVQWAVGGVDWDDDELATEAKRLVDEGRFNGTSVHLGAGRFADVCPSAGGFEEIVFPDDWVTTEVDGEIATFEPPCEILLLGVFDAELAASTIVAVPAFEGAHIEVEGADLILAAASLDRPPKEWFDFPEPDEPTPLTVTDDGQVYGHLAVWDTCHTGFQGRCVTPPRDTDYSYFQTARVITADGSRVPVGPLVVDDGHAPANWSVEKVIRYYADTRLAAAYVTIHSGQYGPWATGAVSHKATPGQVETLRRHALSGDWRKLEGKTRLIAAVSVNGPGFVVPEVLVASGEDVGLVTYGPEPLVDEPSDLALVAAALTRLTDLIEGQRPVVNNLTINRPEPEPDDELEAEVEAVLALNA